MDDRPLDAPSVHPGAGDHYDAALLRARQLRLFGDDERSPAFARWDRALREAPLLYPYASEEGLGRASGLLQCIALAEAERRVQRVCDLLDGGAAQADPGPLLRLDQFALHVAGALWPACPTPARARLRRHLRSFGLWSELPAAGACARAAWAAALVDLIEVACPLPAGIGELSSCAALREAAARRVSRSLSGSPPDAREAQALLESSRALLREHAPALPLVRAAQALVSARLLLGPSSARASMQSP
jgi:hypothetical protein